MLIHNAAFLVVIFWLGDANYRGFKVSEIPEIFLSDDEQAGRVPNQLFALGVPRQTPKNARAQAYPNQLILLVQSVHARTMLEQSSEFGSYDFEGFSLYAIQGVQD